jgi:hypothetical protein
LCTHTSRSAVPELAVLFTDDIMKRQPTSHAPSRSFDSYANPGKGGDAIRRSSTRTTNPPRTTKTTNRSEAVHNRQDNLVDQRKLYLDQENLVNWEPTATQEPCSDRSLYYHPVGFEVPLAFHQEHLSQSFLSSCSEEDKVSESVNNSNGREVKNMEQHDQEWLNDKSNRHQDDQHSWRRPSLPVDVPSALHLLQEAPEKIQTTLWERWILFTKWLHYYISYLVLMLAMKAARNPKRCIVSVITLSLFLAATGYSTNFSMALEDEALFAPYGSASREYMEYIETRPGFPQPSRVAILVVHADGNNVIGYEGMDRMFHAIDTVRGLSGFVDICSEVGLAEQDGQSSPCSVAGASAWWYDNRTVFQNETQGSDVIVRDTFSTDKFAGGTPVFHEFIFGNHIRDSNGTMIRADSLVSAVQFPKLPAEGSDLGTITVELEVDIIDALKDVHDGWAIEDSNMFRLEFLTLRSMADELMRAIANDIPLVPGVFIIMSCFTCLVFFRRDKIQSRTLLGLGSVVTIIMSMLSGYGLAFICGAYTVASFWTDFSPCIQEA